VIRAFVAIDLPADLRSALAAAQAQLKQSRLGVKVTWANVANLHLTLQFLGDVAAPVVPQISAALDQVAGHFSPFEMAVAGVGGFPDLTRPRVVWVGGQGPVIGPLAAAVQRATAPLGFAPEQREFAAHLTLGRIQYPRPDAALTRAVDCLTKQAFGTLRVEAIHLYQSQLHPDGSIYTKLSSHALRGEHHYAAQS
jgi:2'-5' RNA ligase